MTRLLLLSIVLLSSNCFSQVETIKKKDINEPYKEIYYVLKSNKKIKQGSYEKYLLDKLIVKGEFTNDQKSGLWTYYNFKGELEFSFDYSKNELMDFNKNYNFDFKVWHVLKMKLKSPPMDMVDHSAAMYTYDSFKYFESDSSKYDIPPFYSEGNIAFQDLIFCSLLKAIGTIQLNYRTLIELNLDSTGRISDYKVPSNSTLKFEKQFVDDLISRNLKWIPAMKNGVYVSSKYVIPISFMIFFKEESETDQMVFCSNNLLIKIRDTLLNARYVSDLPEIKAHYWICK